MCMSSTSARSVCEATQHAQLTFYEQGAHSDYLYVGETDSISQRIVQHSRSYLGCSVRAAVMRAPNKSSVSLAPLSSLSSLSPYSLFLLSL